MKVDRRNPRHWWRLLLFGANVVAAWCLRPLVARPSRTLVVLYGHKLAGNLLALHRQAGATGECRMVFLTMDAAYARELAAQGVDTCLATRPACALLLMRAHAVVSDHGLHSMQVLPGRCSLRFFDVWHGIPFKGFDAGDFRVQHRYDEVWVASPMLRALYIERFGFAPERVVATGYARTDQLVRPTADPAAIRAGLPVRIPAEHRIILFAPTWKQDAKQRSLWPFGLSEHEFLSRLSASAAAAGASVLVRTHLNSSDRPAADYAGVAWLPYASYPDTEALLLVADLLVCDWSSIAFDFLLLDRPAIFLDVEPPFSRGFSLGPAFRYGALVDGADALQEAIVQSLSAPQGYWASHARSHATVRADVYGGSADGHAAQRCLDRLQLCLTGGSSR